MRRHSCGRNPWADLPVIKGYMKREGIRKDWGGRGGRRGGRETSTRMKGGRSESSPCGGFPAMKKPREREKEGEEGGVGKELKDEGRDSH